MLDHIRSVLFLVIFGVIGIVLSILDLIHFILFRRKKVPVHAVLFKYEGKYADRLVPCALLGQAAFIAIKDKLQRPDGDREVGSMDKLFQKRMLQLLNSGKEVSDGLSTSS